MVKNKDVTEAELDDKGNFIARNEGAVIEVTKAHGTIKQEDFGPKVLAIVDDSKKSKLMLKELKDRKVNVISEIKGDFKDIVKTVLDVVKKESAQDNKYDAVYLPITNDDLNKRSAEFSELKKQSPVTVNLYFQDRSEVDIANKAYIYKIE